MLFYKTFLCLSLHYITSLEIISGAQKKFQVLQRFKKTVKTYNIDYERISKCEKTPSTEETGPLNSNF